MATRAPRDLADAIRRYDDAVRTIALELRAIIHDELTPCYERLLEMKSGAVLIYSATEKPIADGICYMGLNAKHVTLGFMLGADLNDASHLLQGTGKVMRHVHLRGPEDLVRPELRQFLRQARQLAGMSKRKAGARIAITRTRKRHTNPRSSANTGTTEWPKKFF